MKLSSPKPRRISLLRHPRLRSSLRALALPVLNGALVQVASAQTTGATQAAAPSALYSLLQNLCALALLALLVGAVRPQLFTFLFKEKTTRKRVCGTFGVAMVGFAIVGSAFNPKPVAPVVTAQERRARSDQAAAQSQARAAEGRAKAAEARAEKAEKAAALSNAKANEKAKERRVAGRASAPVEEVEAPEKAPAKEPLAENVEVVDIKGMGKREVGTVDDVIYVIGKAETYQTLGPEMYRREADGVFYVLQVVANNTDKKTHDVTTAIMKLVDDQDCEFDPSDEGSLALSAAGEQSAEPFSAQLQPGVTQKFTLVYDAPKDVSGLKLHIPAGGFGFGRAPTSRCRPRTSRVGQLKRKRSKERRPGQLGRRSLRVERSPFKTLEFQVHCPLQK